MFGDKFPGTMNGPNMSYLCYCSVGAGDESIMGNCLSAVSQFLIARR